MKNKVILNVQIQNHVFVIKKIKLVNMMFVNKIYAQNCFVKAFRTKIVVMELLNKDNIVMMEIFLIEMDAQSHAMFNQIQSAIMNPPQSVTNSPII